jgi:hypothetical protein
VVSPFWKTASLFGDNTCIMWCTCVFLLLLLGNGSSYGRKTSLPRMSRFLFLEGSYLGFQHQFWGCDGHSWRGSGVGDHCVHLCPNRKPQWRQQRCYTLA